MAYITIVEADAILAAKVSKAAWTAATTQQKDAALAEATEIIDRLAYVGNKYSETQVNQFPRDVAAVTEVPTEVEKACAYIALSILEGKDLEQMYASQSITSTQYETAKVTYNRMRLPAHIMLGIPSVTAWRYLMQFLRDPRGIRVVRG